MPGHLELVRTLKNVGWIVFLRITLLCDGHFGTDLQKIGSGREIRDAV